VTSSGQELESAVDPRFGRGRYLLVVDLPERTFVAVDNRAGMNATQGAGISAAQSVIDAGATVLISGHCGPKAFRALKAANVDIYLTEAGTVAEALDKYEAGELESIAGADVDGHW